MEFKWLKVPWSNKTKKIQAVQLWFVTWYGRDGPFHSSRIKHVEALTSKEDADTLADSLRAAFKLIRNESEDENKVTVTKG